MSLSLGSEHLTTHRFKVYLGPEIKGNFSKVSGLENEIELETYSEGGDNYGVYTFPKMLKYQHLVLERGIMKIDPMMIWYTSIKAGIITKLPGTVILFDAYNKPAAMWSIWDAYPIKYVGPVFDGLNSEVAITRLEFAHSGIEYIPIPL